MLEISYGAFQDYNKGEDLNTVLKKHGKTFVRSQVVGFELAENAHDFLMEVCSKDKKMEHLLSMR